MPGEGGATTRWRPTVIDQDIDGKVPPETAAGASGAPKGAPETLEQQLEREREARVLMRERLRTTEALAAESHALRARMAQELERVTADRDRLRIEAEAAAAAAPAAAEPPPVRAAAPASGPRHAAARAVEPPLTSGALPPKAAHADDRPLKPPVPASRKGPWGALAMLSVVAVAVGALAWYKGSLPGLKELQAALDPPAPATATAANAEAAPAAPGTRPAPVPPPVAAATVARAAPASGPVALPPLTPDAQLAAAPSAAGPVATATPAGTSTAEMVGRLRKALDGEGIASPVDVDAATGHVLVADPQSDRSLRDRTDMLIRAVYAGASLPEPQIEHRWLSPMRGARETVASTDAPAAAHTVPPTTVAPAAAPSPDTSAAGRHAAVARGQDHRRATDVSVAAAEELTPVLPAGRVTAACMDGLVGRSAVRRANLTACMKHSCCSSAANHNSEECRAYERAYPFTCSAG